MIVLAIHLDQLRLEVCAGIGEYDAQPVDGVAIEHFVAIFHHKDQINEIMLCLYTVGIVGFKISSLTPYKWTFRDSTSTTRNEIKRASLMKIHKMLHSALDIRIITGNRYERDDEEHIECS